MQIVKNGHYSANIIIIGDKLKIHKRYFNISELDTVSEHYCLEHLKVAITEAYERNKQFTEDYAEIAEKYPVLAAMNGYPVDMSRFNPCEVAAVIKSGHFIEDFTVSPDWRNRAAVAAAGHNLDVLINDEHEHVRAEVAIHKFGLDVLVKDTSQRVRGIITYYNLYSDVLVNDSDPVIRAWVASYADAAGIAKSSKDKRKEVRAEVARYTYNTVLLNEMLSDRAKIVRERAAKRLVEINVHS